MMKKFNTQFRRGLKFLFWRVELITLAFDKEEGIGFEIFTVHAGGERDSLAGLIYEELSDEPYKHRVWVSLIFVSFIIEW